MSRFAKIILMLCTAGAALPGRVDAQCTTPGTQALVIVTDGGGRKDTVFFGHHPAATPGLDTALCERELPPPPPGGALDFRFLNPPGREGLNTPAGLGQGVFRDYRPQVSIAQKDTHRVRFQPGTGGLPMTFTWSPAEILLLCDSARLVDEFGGFTVNLRMDQTSGLVVTNPALVTLLLIKHGVRQIPAAPVLVQPADGAAGVLTPVALLWQTVPGAQRYHVQVSTDSLFGSTVVNDTAVTGTTLSAPGLAASVRHFWRVRGSNVLGTGSWSAVWSFTPSASTQFTYSVPEGWSIISLPVVPADTRRTVLFPGSTSFASTFSGGGYVRRDTLRTGEGYWLKFPSAQSPAVTGLVLTADTIPLAAGWNMTGSITAPLPAAAAVTVPPGLLTSPFYSYGGAYAPADTLRPGQGYWVKASAPGQLILGPAPAPRKR